MATVYVTNFAGHDYTNAERYGTIKAVTKGYVSFQSLDRLKFEICLELSHSTKDDWLLISGTPALASVIAAAWIVMHKQVKMLVHDHKNPGTYRELILTEKNFNDIFGVIADGPANNTADVRV